MNTLPGIPYPRPVYPVHKEQHCKHYPHRHEVVGDRLAKVYCSHQRRIGNIYYSSGTPEGIVDLYPDQPYKFPQSVGGDKEAEPLGSQQGLPDCQGDKACHHPTHGNTYPNRHAGILGKQTTGVGANAEQNVVAK